VEEGWREGWTHLARVEAVLGVGEEELGDAVDAAQLGDLLGVLLEDQLLDGVELDAEAGCARGGRG
jgi:hypothetical protein